MSRCIINGVDWGPWSSGLHWWPADFTIGADPSSGPDRGYLVTRPGPLPLDARKATYHPQPPVVVCLALGYTLWFSLDHPTTAPDHTAFYYL
jgi:hypothetical protein